MRWTVGLAVCAAAVSLPGFAFSLETVATDGCHERLTRFASERSSWPGGLLAPEVTHDDAVLAKNLPFDVPAGTDRWTMALMVGVRDNDLEGHSLADLPELAAVHGAADQSAHCLRSADQDFDSGDEAALVACRAFIHGEIEKALGPDGVPDMDATEEVMISMRFQKQTVTLSRYAFHMGRALHALQDSYAHSFRRASDVEVMSVLNYIDPIFSIHFDEHRDGHPHLGAMDACVGTDFAVGRAQTAQDSSQALLSAVALSTSTLERKDRINGVLDKSLAYVPGCDPENGWCGTNLDSVVPQLATQGCSSVSLAGPAVLLALAWLGRRRRS